MNKDQNWNIINLKLLYEDLETENIGMEYGVELASYWLFS
jgi:hypothetical protein